MNESYEKMCNLKIKIHQKNVFEVFLESGKTRNKRLHLLDFQFFSPSSLSSNNGIHLKANASNITVSGQSDYTPIYVHVDFENNLIFLDLLGQKFHVRRFKI